MSFNEIVDTLNRQGHSFSTVPEEVFAGFFPRPPNRRDVCLVPGSYLLGSDSSDQIALANKVAGRKPTTFVTWALVNLPVSGTVASLVR